MTNGCAWFVTEPHLQLSQGSHALEDHWLQARAHLGILPQLHSTLCGSTLAGTDQSQNSMVGNMETAWKDVFLCCFILLLNYPNSGLPWTSIGVDMEPGMAFLKKGNDSTAFMDYGGLSGIPF